MNNTKSKGHKINKVLNNWNKMNFQKEPMNLKKKLIIFN